MINIAIPIFNLYEEFDELKNHLLIIENKKVLYRFLKDMGNGCIYEEFINVFDENGKKLKCNDYIEFISSLMDIDINNKKNINALIRLIRRISTDDLKVTISKLNHLLKESFNKIKLDISVDIIDQIDVSEDDCFKLINIKVVDNDKDLLERLNTYINIVYELRNIKIFVIYGLFSLLEEEQVELLVKNCEYIGVTIIDIENTNIKTKCISNKQILDKDICLLI